MMELSIILCITLIPLVILIVSVITICTRRQLKRAKLQKRQALYISTIQNCYIPTNTNLNDPNQRSSNSSDFDISTINIEEQVAALTLYQSNQPKQEERQNVSEYTKPPPYNPNYY